MHPRSIEQLCAYQYIWTYKCVYKCKSIYKKSMCCFPFLPLLIFFFNIIFNFNEKRNKVVSHWDAREREHTHLNKFSALIHRIRLHCTSAHQKSVLKVFVHTNSKLPLAQRTSVVAILYMHIFFIMFIVLLTIFKNKLKHECWNVAEATIQENRHAFYLCMV